MAEPQRFPERCLESVLGLRQERQPAARMPAPGRKPQAGDRVTNLGEPDAEARSEEVGAPASDTDHAGEQVPSADVAKPAGLRLALREHDRLARLFGEALE